jgi:hypothetical protein
MAKKRKKYAVPKRVAGVKIPKSARRGLQQFIGTQGGRSLMAEAVGALGAAVAASQMKAGSFTRSRLEDADVAGAATSSTAAIKHALGEAVRTFNDNLRRGKMEADARAAWPDEGEPQWKKKSGAETPPSPH